MSFLSLIFKNPFRRKSRALLAIIGISIGIATIVALGGITAGLTAALDDTLHADGSDFSILGKQSDDLSSMGTMGEGVTPYGTETINGSMVDKIKAISGVKGVAGVYIGIFSTEELRQFYLIGMNSKEVGFTDLKVTKGRLYKNDVNEIVIGKLASQELNKTVGDTLTIEGKELKIVGIFESGDQQGDRSGQASLKLLQDLTGDKDHVGIIYAKLESGANVDTVTKEIEDKYGSEIDVITSITDIEQMDEMLSAVDAATWAISLLAIIIGGIGIINTMIMSVYERTREIGVLKAVGWRSSRILAMILGESLVLTIVSGIVGSVLGILAVFLISYSGMLGMLEPTFTPIIFIRAFTIAIIVGLFGGLYPAWRASRLAPTKALSYE